MTSAQRSLAALKDPQFWAWSLLALLPTEILAQWQGWDLVDPPYLVSQILWWPVITWCQLAILALLLQRALPGLRAVASSLNADLLLGLKSGSVLLAGLIPALAWLAWSGAPEPPGRIVFMALAFGGVLPAFIYYLKRALAPAGILRLGLNGPEALGWSQARLQGRLGTFFKLAWPWWALSLGLEGFSFLGAADGPESWSHLLFMAFLGVFSSLAGLIPIAQFVASDETI